jgi:hypothetical protein
MMNKNEYLKFRSSGIHLLYEHYVHKFNPSKHTHLLNQNDFIMCLSSWCDMDELYRAVVSYYDSKHNVIVITDSNNDFITYA